MGGLTYPKTFGFGSFYSQSWIQMAIKQHFPTPSLMLITAKWPEISIQQGCGSVLKTKFSAYKRGLERFYQFFGWYFLNGLQWALGYLSWITFKTHWILIKFRLLKMSWWKVVYFVRCSHQNEIVNSPIFSSLSVDFLYFVWIWKVSYLCSI